MRTIAVVGGGNSSEFEISVKSAREVSASLENIYDTYLVMIRGNDWYYEDGSGRAVAVDKNNFTIKLPSIVVVRFDAVFIAIHGSPGENGSSADILRCWE
ncbi:MAG: hypothetical protein R2744_07985 [Bacteroidales bacterium]